MHEFFAVGESFIHHADPRLKTVAAAVFAAVVAVIDHLPALYLALVAGLALVLLARLEWRHLVRRMIAVNSFFLFMWVFVLFSPGEPLFRIWFLTASVEGLRLSLTITLKGNAIVLSVLALVATSPVFAVFHGLQAMRLPNKLVQLFFFVYRYVHETSAEYQRLRQAMTARGFHPRTNRHTYRSLANLVGSLLLRSWERADRVYAAMRCRGYDGRFHLIHRAHFHTVDWVLAGGVVAVSGVLIAVAV